MDESPEEDFQYPSMLLERRCFLLFTVLIQNKKTCDSFYDHLSLFQGFLEDEDNYRQIDVCEWNEAGKTIEEALPDLYRLTDNQPNWRAVIVRYEDEMPLASHPRAQDNPYDFLDIPLEGVPDGSDPSRNPLIALVQSLANPLEYFDRSRMEKEHRPAPMEFKGVRPQSIILITVRHIDELLSLPRARYELSDPDFAERNQYPSSCRFAVVDRFHQGPYRRRRDDFEFWNIVLMLATSRIDASFFEAYNLHTLSIDIDLPAMETIWNEKYTDSIQIERQIQHLLENQSIHLEKETHAYPDDYQVSISSFDPILPDRNCHIDRKPFAGLTNDSIELAQKWEKEANNIEDGMKNHWDKADEDVQEKVNNLRFRRGYIEEEVDILSPIHQRKFRDELGKLKLKVIDEEGKLKADSVFHKEKLDSIKEKTAELIKERMGKKQIMQWTLLLMALDILGIIPSWLALYKNWSGQQYGQLLVIAGISLVLILFPAGMLFWKNYQQKKAIETEIREWNIQMDRQLKMLSEFQAEYAAYLADMQSLRNGESYDILSRRKKDRQKDYQRELEYLQENIRQYTRQLNKWAAAYNLALSNAGTKTYPVSLGALDEISLIVEKFKEEIQQLFELEPEIIRRCEINETGRIVPAPFSFIKKLSIRSAGRRKAA